MAAAAGLVYLCDWLPPDFGAVGQYALIRARGFAAQGRRVSLYGLSSTADSVEDERVDGGSLRIVRLRAGTYDRTNLAQRAWWTVCINLRLICRAWRDLRACEDVLFTGSPPFLLHFLAPLNVALRRRLTYRITDFFPEVIMAALPRVPLYLRLLHRLTAFWRRRIDQFEVLGEDQRARLAAQGISPQRIALVRDPSPVGFGPDTRPMELPEALRGKRVLLYSGNFGVAHEYETFVETYARHHRAGGGKVVLWLNANGSGADEVERQLSARNLPYLRTRPVPLEQLASLLVTPDAHLITLRAAFVGIVVPSKIFGCIESGRDIIYVGPPESDVHLLCQAKRTRGRYTRIDIGDVSGLLRAIEDVASTRAGSQP